MIGGQQGNTETYRIIELTGGEWLDSCERFTDVDEACAWADARTEHDGVMRMVQAFLEGHWCVAGQLCSEGQRTETRLTFYAALRAFRVALRSGCQLTANEAELLATTLEMFEDYLRKTEATADVAERGPIW